MAPFSPPKARARWWSLLWLAPMAVVTMLWAVPQLLHKPVESEEHEEPAAPAALVLSAAEVVRVEGAALPLTLKVSGTLETLPSGRAVITAELPGRLIGLTLKPGDRVRAEQVVARVQRGDLDATVQEKRSAVAEARSQVAALEAKLPVEERSLDAQRQAAMADEQAAQARLARVKAGNRPEEVERAEAQLAAAQAELERLRNGSLPQEQRQAEAAVREARAEVEVSAKAAARAARLVEAGVAAVRERERADADLARARERQAAAEAALALLAQGTRPELIRAQEQQVRDFQAQVRLVRQGSRPEEIREAEAAVASARAKRTEVEAQARQLEVMRLDAAAGRDRVRQASAAAESARAAAGQEVVRSPIDGVVATVTAAAGEVVQPGRTLAELVSDTSLRLLLQVPAADQAQLRPGLPVTVSLPHQPQVRSAGVVRTVSPTVDPNTGTLTAEAWLPNRNGALRAGLVVEGEVRLGGGRALPVIPDGSVFTLNGEQYVWRLDSEGKVRQTRVELGSERGEQVQVLTGIKVGDRIVRDGHRSIADETPVTVDDENAR